MIQTGAMFLVYVAESGETVMQPWQEVDVVGTPIDPQTGRKMELVGWTVGAASSDSPVCATCGTQVGLDPEYGAMSTPATMVCPTAPTAGTTPTRSTECSTAPTGRRNHCLAAGWWSPASALVLVAPPLLLNLILATSRAYDFPRSPGAAAPGLSLCPVSPTGGNRRAAEAPVPPSPPLRPGTAGPRSRSGRQSHGPWHRAAPARRPDRR